MATQKTESSRPGVAIFVALAGIIGGLTAIAFLRFGTLPRWWTIGIVVVTHMMIGGGFFVLFYLCSFRWLPNLALGCAWTILVLVLFTAIQNSVISSHAAVKIFWMQTAVRRLELLSEAGRFGKGPLTLFCLCVKTQTVSCAREPLTFITLLKDAYFKSQIDNSFIKTSLEIYSIGLFGTVFLSLASEVSKGVWTDEIRSTENKTLLAKFKRARRMEVLRRSIPFFKQGSVVYFHLMLYAIMLLITIAVITVLSSGDQTAIRLNLILMLVSVTMEAAGVATHVIISDQSLAACERKKLQQRSARIAKQIREKLEPQVQGRTSLNSSTPQAVKEGLELPRAAANHMQVLVHTYCSYNLNAPMDRWSFYPNSLTNDAPRMAVAADLICRFFTVDGIYIKPNEEKYYTQASKHFAPTFAADLSAFLFSPSSNSDQKNQLPTSLREMLALARSCLFTKQRSYWEDWLYTSGLNYETMVDLLILDYLHGELVPENHTHLLSLGTQLSGGDAYAYASLLLEFPYVIELYARKRMESGDFPSFAEDATQDSEQFYRDRVEQYYYELYCKELCILPASDCDKAADRFSAFLTKRYQRKERYLCRILPINDAEYRSTDTPEDSIKLSFQDARDLPLSGASTAAQGWNELFEHASDVCGVKRLSDKVFVISTDLDHIDREVSSLTSKIENINLPFDADWVRRRVLLRKDREKIALDLEVATSELEKASTRAMEGLPILHRLSLFDLRNQVPAPIERVDRCCIDRQEQCRVLACVLFQKENEELTL